MHESALTRISGVSGAKIDHDVAFRDLTTLRLGGRPVAAVRCATVGAVVEVVRILDDAGVPLLIVGGGSNLVVADEPGGLVAVVIEADDVVLGTSGHGLDVDGATVEAEAGAVWDDVVEMSVAAGFGGLECLSGIPGSAGATPVQNVGAYGAEVSSTLEGVRLYDRRAGVDEWVSPESLDLAYRYSNLKFTARAVVLAVRFRLTVDGMSAPLRYGELAKRLGVGPEEGASGEARRPVADVREAVLALRRGKGMVLDDADHDTWSAGSFFTNPIVGEAEVENVRERVAARCGDDVAQSMPSYPGGKLSAAWLIERAGFPKGHPGEGAPARLSTKHTLALTNRGDATAADLIALAREIRDGVRDAFGVSLVPEPVWIGAELD
ncbi:UDP-N-acetylenolpyruvoylglucosamine reductase [Corynebacterium xerosis]|uniref:UDP-N-acetylenolpyruvoylglucosamine reductase n=1 Tax=Corynebacterium xerosis TaxID=1725 RepID=A0A2N6T153_9CORY|nr:UDP-N-acetylmuramate dehydrogenase [Corynebacterium xerosis]PMC63025.1 UDP-N-acetylenolpyruvoylglucosamine reductase [Corynebacterium xerosis]